MSETCVNGDNPY